MADDFGGFRYDLTPEDWARLSPVLPQGYQPLQPPAEPRPAVPNAVQQLLQQQYGPPPPGRWQFGLGAGTAGNNRTQLKEGLDPRYLQLFGNRLF
jgi:hypothetical protein